MSISLRTLLSAITDVRCLGGDLDRTIAGIAVDSRQVGEGWLFVAVPGVHDDGHRHIEQALARGACAIVAQDDRLREVGRRWKRDGVAVLTVPSSRRAVSQLGSAFYGHPSKRLSVVGVTGTNGKTTVTYLLRSLLGAAGHPTGLIGTVGYQIGRESEPSVNTTPGPLELHRLFARMCEEGDTHVVMEASSHALDQGRVDDVAFRAAIFTNLTHDHLDYHHTIEAYFTAKARLFELLDAQRGRAVVNVDDAYGRRLRWMDGVQHRAMTYGLEIPAAVTASDIAYGMDGTSCRLVTPAGELEVWMPLVGQHNVSNMLGAVAAALVCDVPLAVVREALARFEGVPGRLEQVQTGTSYSVFVDYAHTPDGLRNVLGALRALPHRRLIAVFGCGGDRDRGKRSHMGAIATALADVVVLTTDNPRSEQPEAILRDVQAGVRPEHRHCYTVVDRADAIRRALAMAEPGDVVVIAGKGHERCQIIGSKTVPFDDRQVVWEALKCSPLPISS